MQIQICFDFLVDSALSAERVSLEFEDRLEDKANFPETLNNFFTSCIGNIKFKSQQTYLFSFFFTSNCRVQLPTIFDRNRFNFDLLTRKQRSTLHALYLQLNSVSHDNWSHTSEYLWDLLNCAESPMELF